MMINRLLKITLIGVVIICSFVKNSFAGNGCGSESNAYAHYVDYSVTQLYKAEITGREDAETLALKQRYPQLLAELNKLLYAACEKSGYFENFSNKANQEKYLKELGTYDTYMQKVAELKEVAGKINAIKVDPNVACGEEHPYGCPNGTKCYKRQISSINASTKVAENKIRWECSAEDPGGDWLGVSNTQVENSGGKGSYDVSAGVLDMHISDTNADGVTTNISVGLSALGAEGSLITTQEFAPVTGEVAPYVRSNASCDIAGMQKNYQSRCYSCKIILTLITVFMNACAQVYDLTREAGSKVLVIGCLFWFASFSLKKVSAFTSQEPMPILNELFIFMFKAMAAYIVLNFGIAAIVNLFINPLLVAGADYGIGLLKAANSGIIDIATSTNYEYKGTQILPAKTINKLMALTQGIDKTVATNLVIGHALTCHATHAGMITLVDTEAFGFQLTLSIPDIWIWLCGAAIWFCGFMLTLGVGYYLLDTSYKIGFCIIALPIVIGLWPFGKTQNKFNNCMSIIFRSAGLFAFLALTVSYALTLVNGALGDVSTLYAKIEAGDSAWVSDTFSITGSHFILIMFAYIYGIKLVGATADKLLSKFFSDGTFGNEVGAMHGKATQMTDFAKQKVVKAASYATDVVTHQGTRMVGAVAGKATKAVSSMAKGAVNMAKRNKSSGSDDE